MTAAEDLPAAPGPLAGLDPGRSKCGLVLTDPGRRTIREALVLPPEAAWERLEQWRRREALAAVVIGDGNVPPELVERARLAVANCPEFAITLSE